MSRPALEVADVVRQHGSAFLARYGATLGGEQHRALRAILLCRTAALGGHTTRCDHCAHEESSYNSCRNRHCPKCHGATQAAWLAKQQQYVLDTPYVHTVFTLPQALGPLVLQIPVCSIPCCFALSPKPSWILPAIPSISVPTWRPGRPPYLGPTTPASPPSPLHPPCRWLGPRWLPVDPCRPHFFLPVRVLSRRFRHLYLAGLESLQSQGQLTLAGRCRELTAPQPWRRLLGALRDKEWVVYAKKPLPEPQHVLKYLARYTHRVAISNQRLVALQDGHVTFRWKDYTREGCLRTQTLDAVEFLRRFFLHILPTGLHKIRTFGFLANRHRQAKLAHCRTLLGQAPPPPVVSALAAPTTGDHTGAPTAQLPGVLCPVCQHGHMQLVETVYRQAAAWDLSLPVPVLDTS